MAGSFVVSGQNVTIKFEYTAEITKAQETVFACAKSVYQRHPITRDAPDGFGGVIKVPIPFDNLTVQQKLDVVDAWVLDEIITRAKKQYEKEAIDAAMAAAMESASNESDEKFI